ncbi:MAG: hypothetical protein E3J21_15235 [Anaerolineales bacterium]|nr:MAG: hypothetical protein E3J21_15235 [Anaerolineales bacterium]
MKRKALLKNGDEFVVLEESDFDAETALQEALKRNPEVIPVADLDLGEVVVVGRETPLPVGAIDLLLLDAEGRVIIVETKLSRNPELRRQVVAQVLDYGASLWRTAPTLKEFEAMVLWYWHSDACEDEQVKDVKSLRQGLEPIFKELCGEEWDYDTFEATLAENLANGQHVLLVVASGLMDRLSRDLLQYVNFCLNVPLYGVEIDVFETAGRQLIVPRGVRYGPERRPPTPTRGPIDRTTFLAACMPPAATFFERMLNEAEERGMIFYWGYKGFSVRMPLEPPVTVMYGFPPDEFQVYTGNWSLDTGQAEFRRRLSEVAPFKPSGQYTNILHLDEKTQQQAYAALAFMWGEVEEMMAAARGDE